MMTSLVLAAMACWPSFSPALGIDLSEFTAPLEFVSADIYADGGTVAFVLRDADGRLLHGGFDGRMISMDDVPQPRTLFLGAPHITHPGAHSLAPGSPEERAVLDMLGEILGRDRSPGELARIAGIQSVRDLPSDVPGGLWHLLRSWHAATANPAQQRGWRVHGQVPGFAAAADTLAWFLEALASGDYPAAADLYGGPWAILEDWNPDVDPADHAALLARGCEINGLQCRPVFSIAWMARGEGGVAEFSVTFATDDGEIFLAPLPDPSLAPTDRREGKWRERMQREAAIHAFTVREVEGRRQVFGALPYGP
jgi:hypothetical protein